MLRRFQPGGVKDPYGPLLRVKQLGSMMDYIEQFECVAGPLKDVDRGIMRGIFVNGLRPELQAEIKSLDLDSLAEIKERALMLEERNREWKGGGVVPFMKRLGDTKGPSISKSTPSVNRNWGNKENSTGERGSGTGKRLSQAELQERSRKGLCFKCGERWGLDHVCKLKHYKLVLVEGSDEEHPGEGDQTTSEEEPSLELKTLEISFNSLKGLTSSKSFKVMGRLEGQEVVILVDTGATSNFISKELARQLGLTIEETPIYTVEVGTGQKERSSGVCQSVGIEAQGIHILQPFFLLELGGVDVVLGMRWLAGLGEIAANFQELTMSWKEKGEIRRLKGDPALGRSQASWKATLKALKDDGEGYFITAAGGGPEPEVGMMISVKTKQLLEEFEDLCQLPKGLPPKRDKDHAINLKEGAEIPHVRPYRYPYFQKNEIEKIIDDMLHAGIIRPSTSPYSSPVILVRKKDGS